MDGRELRAQVRFRLSGLWERVYPAIGRGIKPLPQSGIPGAETADCAGAQNWADSEATSVRGEGRLRPD
jgi:hypothetical protein